MIIVLGHVRARPENLDELLALSREHVARSRQEPGCLSHAVHQEVDDPLRLVFVEKWQDAAALAAHFAVAESREFAAAIARLAADKGLELFSAEPARIGR